MRIALRHFSPSQVHPSRYSPSPDPVRLHFHDSGCQKHFSTFLLSLCSTLKFVAAGYGPWFLCRIKGCVDLERFMAFPFKSLSRFLLRFFPAYSLTACATTPFCPPFFNGAFPFPPHTPCGIFQFFASSRAATGGKINRLLPSPVTTLDTLGVSAGRSEHTPLGYRQGQGIP